MPKSSPKQHVDRDDPTRAPPEYHNRRRRKRVLVVVSALAIIAIVIGWNLATTWPDVRPGDTVRIKYGIWAADGSWIEGADDLTVYVDLSYSPHVIYFEIAHARIGVLQDFAVVACPSPPCAEYDGYTSGSHAWQAIRGNVTVQEILNR